MTTRAAIAAACVSALMLWLASPGVGLGWLAWVAIVPVAVVVLAAPGSPGARLAVPLAYGLCLELLLVPALPFGIAAGEWGDPVVPVLVGDSPVLAVALLAVPAVAALLWVVRFGLPWGAAGLPGRWAALATVLVPAAAWMGLDLARAKLDPGGLWGPLFLTQASTPAGGLAGLAGPWAISFAIVAVNYSLALAIVRRRARPAIVAVGAVAAAVLVCGLAWERDRDGDGNGGRTVAVAAVQPGYDTVDDDLPVLRHFEPGGWDRAALDVIGEVTPLVREAAARGAEAIVFPEAMMYVAPRPAPAVIARLRGLARETGAVLVFPYFHRGPERGMAIAISPGGAVSEPRPKQRPMWYLGETSVAAEPLPIAAGGLQIGTLLGVDVVDPAIAARLAANGAELLASSTHDFAGSTPSQRAYARLAARAAGVPLVRADWRYGSALYTADGKPAADAGEELARAAPVAELRLGGPATPYRALGDAPAYALLAALAAVALAGGLTRWARRAAVRGRRRPGSRSAAGRRAAAPPPPSTAARRR